MEEWLKTPLIVKVVMAVLGAMGTAVWKIATWKA